MAAAFATTARPRRFLRRVWPATYTNAEEIEEGRGRGRHAATWERNGNAPTTGGGGDGRAIDSKPRTKEAIASKATSSQSPLPHRKRQRCGVGRG
eukprot:scaffold118762_cov38-Phaeocystis_antarctica.AAC.2